MLRRKKMLALLQIMNRIDHVNAHTSTQEPIHMDSKPSGKVCAHRNPVEWVFSFPATAMDAIDNGLESGSFHGKTGDPFHQGKPTGVYASDRATVLAGDKIAGTNRILQGSLVLEHGAGPRSNLTLG